MRHLSCGWYPTTGITATSKGKGFILVYRLGDDGDLLKEGGAHAFGLGVKSLLL